MPLINWWTRSARGRVGDGRAKGEKGASQERSDAKPMQQDAVAWGVGSSTYLWIPRRQWRSAIALVIGNNAYDSLER